MTVAFNVAMELPLVALNGGLFVARGRGERHGERVIDSHELIFVQQGRLGMREEGAVFDIAAGQALILRAGRKHGGTEAYPGNLRFYWVHFRLKGDVIAEGASMEIPQFATLAEPERLTTLFRRFLDDQETGRQSMAAASLNVLQMLVEIAQPANMASTTPAHILAQRTGEYIRVHATEQIGARDIAAALGYHPDYTGRVFKDVFGISVTDALNKRRIFEAKQNLLNSALTIDQIARLCGFSDAEYFRRVFRKYEAMSPGQFRRMYARVHINSE